MAEIKEFFGTGKSEIRSDKKMTERRVVVCVMKHPEENKYLCVKNKKFGWVDFVMGGIEGDESPIEAGEREIIEESGYDDFGELYEISGVVCYDNFYAAHKDVNRHIEVRVVYGELKTLKQQERTQEEKDLADVMWIDGGDLENMLTQEAHRYVWERVREERG